MCLECDTLPAVICGACTICESCSQMHTDRAACIAKELGKKGLPFEVDEVLVQGCQLKPLLRLAICRRYKGTAVDQIPDDYKAIFAHPQGDAQAERTRVRKAVDAFAKFINKIDTEYQEGRGGFPAKDKHHCNQKSRYGDFPLRFALQNDLVSAPKSYGDSDPEITDSENDGFQEVEGEETLENRTVNATHTPHVADETTKTTA